MKNEFFNPDECPFEVLGFFEDFDDAVTRKPLGSRRIESPDRVLGANGRKEYIFTETIVLNKGHKQVELKASPKRPRRVIGTLQILCGKVKEKRR